MNAIKQTSVGYQPKVEDIYTVLDLIHRGVIDGFDWAGSDYTECLLPWGMDQLRDLYIKTYEDA